MPLELKSKEVPAVLLDETNQTDEQSPVLVNQKIEKPAVVPRAERPSLSSLLNQSNKADQVSETGQIAQAAPSPLVKAANWLPSLNKFVDDLRVMFPALKVEEDLLNLTGDLTWQLQVDAVMQLQDNFVLSSMPQQLNANERRKLWAFLQTHGQQ